MFFFVDIYVMYYNKKNYFYDYELYYFLFSFAWKYT